MYESIKNSPKPEEIEQQQELENIIQDLEEENSFLMDEYTRLQQELNSNNAANNGHNHRSYKSATLQSSHRSKHQKHAADVSQTENGNTNGNYSRAMSSSPTSQLYSTTPHSSHHFGTQRATLTNNGYQYYSSLNNSSLSGNLLNASNMNTSASAMNRLNTLFSPLNPASAKKNKLSSAASATLSSAKESQIISEARMLRQHEDRLEARMRILENHNRLLDSQLKQLKGLLNVSFKKYFELDRNEKKTLKQNLIF